MVLLYSQIMAPSLQPLHHKSQAVPRPQVLGNMAIGGRELFISPPLQAIGPLPFLSFFL